MITEERPRTVSAPCERVAECSRRLALEGFTPHFAERGMQFRDDPIWVALRDVGTPWITGHTFAQNPVAAAAGLAVLDYLQRHDLVRAARERGAQLLAGLQGLIDQHRILGDARGLGLLLGIELVQDRATREPFAVEAGVAFRFARACIDAGVTVYPGQSGADGLVGDHALVTPPLTISREQVDELVAGVDRALTAIEAGQAR